MPQLCGGFRGRFSENVIPVRKYRVFFFPFTCHKKCYRFIVVVKFAMNWMLAHSHFHRFLRVSHGKIHGKPAGKPRSLPPRIPIGTVHVRKKIIDPEHLEFAVLLLPYLKALLPMKPFDMAKRPSDVTLLVFV